MLIAIGAAVGWLFLDSRTGDNTKPGNSNNETTIAKVDAPPREAVKKQDSDPIFDAEPDEKAGPPREPAADGDKDRPTESKTTKQAVPADPFPRKTPAPPLEGGVEWLNTAGPIEIEDLRGKIVLLDFWTYCCINCMHILPDLKKLEQKYANQLVVIGVHSAKFDGERDSQNIREAVMRYEIEHPVVNDANMAIWRRYHANSWPTVLLIDPEGNLVGGMSGEGVFEPFDEAIGRLVAYHRAKGTLRDGPVRFELEHYRMAATPLRFPGKVVGDATRLFISDSNHNRIVVAGHDGKRIDVIGSGAIGSDDGPYDKASFFRPQGLLLDGSMLYVADTENHLIRRVDLAKKQVTTVAGTGLQGTSRSHSRQPARETGLNSPWDLWLHAGKLFVAMAGNHQIWTFDPSDETVAAYAGSGREHIIDGELEFAALAQPSGLAGDGKTLFVADSEVSGIRAVSLKPDGEVQTIIGEGLFEFGDVDGAFPEARLQHPLGVCFHDGKLYVADTYNNKIKVVDPAKRTATTWLGTGKPGRTDDPPLFDEPSGLTILGGKMYITDTNNHAIRVVDMATKKVSTLSIAGLEAPRPPAAPATGLPHAATVTLEPVAVKPGGPLTLSVQIELAEGQELNEAAPMSFLVESVDGKGLVAGDLLGKRHILKPPASKLQIALTAGSREGAETLRVSTTYYPCQKQKGGLCEIKSAVWVVPVQVAATATGDRIELRTAKPEPAAKPNPAAKETSN
jgi:thiol-disulfide isomerase/thioredoxin